MAGRTRVVKTRSEFEGRVSEELALVQGRDLRAWPADAELREVGRERPRVDGVQRVSGRARYNSDLVLPGMLHARVLRSPHPHARVTRIETKRAQSLPGVRAIVHRFNEADHFAEEVRFVGDHVAAVAAESEAVADDALRLIDVEYDVLPFVVDLEEAMKDRSRAKRDDAQSRGDVRKGFKDADAVVDVTYRTSTALHNCLEPHGCVAAWDGDRLTLYESTQALFDVRSGVAEKLKLDVGDVRVLCDFMGGGFGSKLGDGHYTVLAAVLARRTGRPVRLFLDRHEENLAAGNRSATVQRIRAGGTKDGRITALEHLAWSGTGTEDGWVAGATGPSSTVYDVPNVRTEQYLVLTDTGPFCAFRAPGYVEGTFALESAIDELAERLGVDPLAMRKKCYARRDPQGDRPFSLKRLDQCYARGAELIGWSKRKVGGTPARTSHLRRGLGMATQFWGSAGGPPAYATVHLNVDGTAVVRSGTQDIGSGTRTALAQIAAEELGLELGKIRVASGDTDAPYTPASGGSWTTPSTGPAVRLAAADARRQLFEVAAGLMEVRPTEIRFSNGHLVAGRGGRKITVRDVLERFKNYTVIGTGARHPNPSDLRLGSFGAQFADVEVDTRTGFVRVVKIVAVHQVGRVVNPRNARSQVEGGVLQGLGFALLEGRVLDLPSGHVLNANLEDYHLPTVKDAPDIVVEFIPDPDARSNNVGGIGLGEPPIIPTAGAIANAIANACGARVRTLPITPSRVLEALRR
jgi:xanthine dehydrogenase YagR molybdenum-binding subunit